VPLFAKSKEHKARQALAALLMKIGQWALLFVESVSQSKTLGSTDSMTMWKVHTEVLGLLCHLVSRWALAIGGPEFRALLQDFVTPTVIEAAVESSFDISKAKPGFNVKAWKERVKKELLHNVNTMELEYSRCKSIMGSEEYKNTWMFRDDNVVGRFTGNISRLFTDDPVSLVERGEVAVLAIHLITESGISHDIENVWRNSR